MKKGSFYKITSNLIAIKKINESEKGNETSHQTHIGLFEGSLKEYSQPRRLHSQVLFEDDSYDCLSFIEPIVPGDKTAKKRSPKIREGNKNDDFIFNGVVLKSAYKIIIDIINETDPSLNWYILWFEVDTEEIIYLLFNEESHLKKEIENTIAEPIHPKKSKAPWNRKIFSSDGITFTNIVDFLSNKLEQANLDYIEYIEDLQEDEPYEPQFAGKVTRREDIQKNWTRIRETGRKGEELINNELEMLKIHGEIEEFTWMNKHSESGEPFDFKILVQNEYIFIDVKASVNSFNDQKFYISRNELAFISNKEDAEYKVVSVSDIEGNVDVRTSVMLPAILKKIELNKDINSFSEKITGYNMKLEGLNKLKIRLNTDSVNFEKGLTIS